ncbi:hypothetical protein TcasGA2_TC016261 [Tribolium castaneum]|uniref:Uncharacterized protein n=1 Tax=Tribolium castaneum TaxID=7070 RepID=D6X2X7_TRICA|nr:hypothetical protein TcasGA2_TC016261 [Tribolium castaneum]
MSLRNTERWGLGRSTGAALYYRLGLLLNIIYDGAPHKAAQTRARMDQGLQHRDRAGAIIHHIVAAPNHSLPLN